MIDYLVRRKKVTEASIIEDFWEIYLEHVSQNMTNVIYGSIIF